jgi:membrane glycosyltransferase
MVLALVWGAAVFLLNRSFFWWLTPILIPIFLAAPLSVWTSDVRLGRLLRRWGIFLTPAELDPPEELRYLRKAGGGKASTEPECECDPSWDGFIGAVADPRINGLHIAMLRGGRRVAPQIATRRRQLVRRAAEMGPGHLSPREKTELLGDAESLSALHRLVWGLPDGEFSRQWGI